MSRFTLPRDIYFGDGSLETLKTLKGKKAIVVVGGGSMKRFGFLDKACGYLKEAGLEVKLIEGVEPDPSVETVMNGAAVMREFQPDWIVSIGGGSPIDAAKAMWIFYEYPDFTFQQAVVPFGLPELRQKAKFAAIPSTSGTATEVTSFSVITDYKKKIKYPIADFNITPDIAIVDPELAQTMPPKLTAHTGMDALTHAIEAYVAGLRSAFSDPLAMEAIVMVKQYLLKSYNGDKEARSQMHYAQCLAGMAFSNALLGITHSMAHKTGAVFHIPHGCANAIFLPYVIQYNSKSCGDRYAAISKRLGLTGETEEELVDALINFVRGLNKKLSIPSTMKDYGITEEDFNANVEYIAHNAVLDACTGANPRPIDDKTMEKLLTCIFYGNDVLF
ncbi:MAG: iron-containing alcohol dehydrogenase [Clostridiaceae bacterium]